MFYSTTRYVILYSTTRYVIFNHQVYIYISLEPQWPLFLKVNPPKQGLYQPKQRSKWVPGQWNKIKPPKTSSFPSCFSKNKHLRGWMPPIFGIDLSVILAFVVIQAFCSQFLLRAVGGAVRGSSMGCVCVFFCLAISWLRCQFFWG